MAVYKEEKTGTWRAVYRYTDWNGERKQTQKRGFKTKREAQAWEREQVHKTSADLDMNFKSFVELYTADMKTRLKENTWATKEHIIRTKLLPYFGKLKMCNITAQQIITWQNEMLNHKDEKGQPIHLCTWKRFTISLAPSSTTRFGTITSGITLVKRQAAWGKRKTVR